MLIYNLILIFGLSLSCSADISQHELLEYLSLQDPRIINGTNATLEATRHQVSIRQRRKDGYYFGIGHICGGSLISENVVLGAAHCFVNYEDINPETRKAKGNFHSEDYFIFVMGNLDRFDYNNNTLKFNAKKIIKGVEVFNVSTYANDIILVVLDGKVPVNHPTVRPIILNDSPLENNTLCHVSGWGKTEKGLESDVLLTVDLPIIDTNDCREKTWYTNLLDEGMICAGYLEGQKDSCKGDSGGALVCGGLQAGITSFGLDCAQPFAPSVSTNVTFYKNWILDEVAKHNGTLPQFATFSNYSGHGKNESKGGGDGLHCPLALICLIVVYNFFT